MLSERELAARVDINWERYVKVCNIEASMRPRHRQDADPPGGRPLPRAALRERSGVEAASTRSATKVAALTDRLVMRSTASSTRSTRRTGRPASRTRRGVRRIGHPGAGALRKVADELETVVADDLWPLPKYRELLFQY